MRTTTRLGALPHLQQLACNVYISLAATRARDCLTGLLSDAQSHCRRLVGDAGNAVVVHAFADPNYNRTSIHLAGTAKELVSVASQLCIDAYARLLPIRHDDDVKVAVTNCYDHPTVGLIDHVAVMPLIGRHDIDNGDNALSEAANKAFVPTTPSGMAARGIGRNLQQQHPDVNIYYYGTAHEDSQSLARIRREHTSFFQSDTSMQKKQPQQVTTIGAPPQFVENFNIRLRGSDDPKVARSLTRRLRERDGGLPGVEALTLPYQARDSSVGIDGWLSCWEVACNLTLPDLGSVEQLRQAVNEWERQLANDHWKVLKCYRVGTTAEECLETLQRVRPNRQKRQAHDDHVLQRFESYLTQA